MTQAQVETVTFEDDGRIPNNEHLPLVLYRSALPDDQDLTEACRQLFQQNNWRGTWVNGVFSYHHYHSTSHEVLGVTAGHAEVQFGGPQGEVFQVTTGDVVIIPAGVGHCQQSASPDFRVVGAYPDGRSWDLCTGDPDERPEVLENIAAVPLPDCDPVYGNDGALSSLWEDT